jgi:3-methyladenine DNA glycosylase/8-oxoguanine DNA glycosylase
MNNPQYHRFTPPHPIDVKRSLSPIKRGRRDATALVAADGVWRATRTPSGPAVQHIRNVAQNVHNDIETRAWGPGAEWLLERCAVLVGSQDANDNFPDHHPALSQVHQRLRNVRFCHTKAIWEALLPSVIEQKVTGREARRSYAHLLSVFGESAPCPSDGPALVLPPDAQAVADAPSHTFHAANIERKRSDTLRAAASYVHRFAELADAPLRIVQDHLLKLPGIGEWTVAEVCVVALGDADAVSVGDYHTKNWVSWNLAGEPRGTDERMIALLEPFRPHRGRAVRYIQAGGSMPPRYGPRITIQKRY